MAPSEFWNLSPWEFWLEFDCRADQARKTNEALSARAGGKSVPIGALKEAQEKARALHAAKKKEAHE